jgi:hypothetical protein
MLPNSAPAIACITRHQAVSLNLSIIYYLLFIVIIKIIHLTNRYKTNWDLNTHHPRQPVMVSLICVRTGDSITIDQSPFTFGRNADSHHMLHSMNIPLLGSRRHAVLTCRPSMGDHTITDMGSVNMTWLNGEAIPAYQPTVIGDGAVVAFGGPNFVYRNGVRNRNPFVYRFSDEREARRLRGVRLRGIMRCIPRLLLWRRVATEAVFAPENMECVVDADGGPILQPSRRLLDINHQRRLCGERCIRRLHTTVNIMIQLLAWRRRAASSVWRHMATRAEKPSKRRRIY